MTVDSLELEMDLRMLRIWNSAEGREIVSEDLIGDFALLIRCAYFQGYVEALEEDTQGHRGKLLIDHALDIRREKKDS